MIADYQFFHGAMIHEVIAKAKSDVRFGVRALSGRASAYVLNGAIGLLMKHSSARMSPWQFTFTAGHLRALEELACMTSQRFVVFICSKDGYACVTDRELVELLPHGHKEVVGVRVERRARQMYRLTSAGSALDRKIPRGVDRIVDLLTQQSTECVLPSCEIGEPCR